MMLLLLFFFFIGLQQIYQGFLSYESYGISFYIMMISCSLSLFLGKSFSFLNTYNLFLFI